MLLSNSKMMFPTNRSVISPASPRSPLDIKPSKRYDTGGIGLGIVAALEFSSNHNPVCNIGSALNRSDPVHCVRRFQFPEEIDPYEEYTCVTKRDGMTKVYYNDDEFELCQNHQDRRWNKPLVIPLMEKTDTHLLSCCCLCNKKLQGKDIYMYKGDKGFCSEVCRSVRITEDNLKERHRLRSVEVLRSPYTGKKVSSAGIFVI